MSITPTCTSGTTILCADETSRNNAVSSTYNAHDHNDIDQTANTLNVGDGAAGNKNICGNAADSTDSCIRWNDTANLWTVDHPTAGTFNQIVTMTGTAGLTTGTILMADGTGSIRSLTSVAGADDQTLVWDSATAATPRTLPNCVAATEALRYTQSTNSFSCGTISSGDVGGTNATRVHRTAGNVTTTSTTLVDFTGASITITTAANPIHVGFLASCSTDTAAAGVVFNVDIDGSVILGSGGLQVLTAADANENRNCSFTMQTAALTAASHTIKLQWRADTASTATTPCSSTNACTFWVTEVVD